MLELKKMRKVDLITLQGYRRDLISSLHQKGILHIENFSNKAGEYGLDAGKPIDKSEIHSLNLRVKRILDVLGKPEESDKGFLEKIKSTLKASDKEKLGYELTDIKNDYKPFIENLEERLDSLEERLSEINSKLKNLKETRNNLGIYKSLGIPLSFLGEGFSTYTYIGQGSKSNLKSLKNDLEKITETYYLETSEDGSNLVLVLNVLKEHKEEVTKAIRRNNFDLLETELENTPKEEIKTINDKIKELKEKKEKTKRQLKGLKENHLQRLLKINEILKKELERGEVQAKFGESKQVFVIEGWISKNNLKKLKNLVNDITEGNSIIDVKEPKENEKPPVEFDNPWYLGAFEKLTRMYGLPSYGELDPTPILALFLPLFFGFMFGDFGHGIIVFLVGLGLYKYAEGTIKEFSIVLLFCGFFAMIMGLLYGEFMGMPFSELGINYHAPLHVGLGHGGHIQDAIMRLLLLSLGVGVFHIGLGILMDLGNRIKKSDYLSSIVPVAKLWVYFGAIYLIIRETLMMGHGFQIMEWNFPLMIAFLVPPLIILVFGELLAEYGEIESKREAISLIGEGFFEAFHDMLGFLSNTFSYSRLFALALVHMGLFIALGKISFVFSDLIAGGGILGYLIWFAIYVVGTVFILGLDGVIVFLHSLRLHFYEWFDKFFSGGGRSFEPFKM
ncbi:MAG: Archaeal/vacuolar-type H+-ATPase subunit I [Candidatus Methanohalarchaeum thermophilum]|uniref:A-type ATP synthase subunit I n=1 Tax=Methanohalarchaeum thermophilum TaxID=1903181 RepID=A0A1Q6DUQ5_METT1|nr:MAG: Archaeal/vacuolar-type H+-ATPase subunit I [Candidatus Methanohalarchaeum thermophilum]